MVQKNIESNNLLFFSFIIPIFERENELKELLDSMLLQTVNNFEVIIIDDGSKTNLLPLINLYTDKLTISYTYKDNQGASVARNLGANFANGNYLLFVDSDCILPKNYVQSLTIFLEKNTILFFGGPDNAGNDFSSLQKALSYTMTGFFTTGGIRGGLNSKNFQPRSFNMGISKTLFLDIGGFKDIKIGEDIDLSLRIKAKGIESALIPEAKVYHKRRSNLTSFSKRIYNFGKMRPVLMKCYAFSRKPVFYFPSLFLLGSIFSFILSFWKIIALIPIISWIIAVWFESFYKFKSFKVSCLAVITSFIQIYSYGIGFLRSSISLTIFKNFNV